MTCFQCSSSSISSCRADFAARLNNTSAPGQPFRSGLGKARCTASWYSRCRRSHCCFGVSPFIVASRELWHTPPWMQVLLWSFGKIFFDPSFETFARRLRGPVAELLSDFLPRISLPQHREALPDVLAVLFGDPAFDERDQQILFVNLAVVGGVGNGRFLNFSINGIERERHRVLQIPT